MRRLMLLGFRVKYMKYMEMAHRYRVGILSVPKPEIDPFRVLVVRSQLSIVRFADKPAVTRGNVNVRFPVTPMHLVFGTV